MAHSVTCDSCGTARVVETPWSPANDYAIRLPEGWYQLGLSPAGAELRREQQRHVCSEDCALEAVKALVMEHRQVVACAAPGCHRPAMFPRHLCQHHQQLDDARLARQRGEEVPA